jgi:hypothetical protein
VRIWHRAQGTEEENLQTDDTDSKTNTNLKAPLGGFGGETMDERRLRDYIKIH